jgi:hypothetical protein
MVMPWDNTENINIGSTNQINLINIGSTGNINIGSQKPKIAIGLPYNGKVDMEFVERTYGPLRFFPLDWCIKSLFLSKVPSISVARDTLVKSALSANCDYILFLDSDHVVEKIDPNAALGQLYSVINKDPNSKDGKIVSALYRAKQSTGFNWAAWIRYDPTKHGIVQGLEDKKKGYISILEWTGNYLEIDVIGLGFCLVDMKVFREVPGPWFNWNEQGEISEDFYFCELAKKYGFNTKVFTDVRLSHLGNLKVKSDGSITIQEM